MKKVLITALLSMSLSASAQIIVVDSGEYFVTNSTVLDRSCRQTIPVSCQVNDVGQFSFTQVQNFDLVSQELFVELENSGELILDDRQPYWLANPDFNFNSITTPFHSQLSHGIGNAVAGSSFFFYITATLVDTPTPSAVPIPAAVWLFGSGLVGLVGVARRRK